MCGRVYHYVGLLPPADIPEVRGPKAPGALPTTFDNAHSDAEAIISGVSGL